MLRELGRLFVVNLTTLVLGLGLIALGLYVMQ